MTRHHDLRSRMSCASWTKPWSKWRIAMPPKVHCCRCKSRAAMFWPGGNPSGFHHGDILMFMVSWHIVGTGSSSLDSPVLVRSICLAEAMSLPMIQMLAMKKLDFWLVQWLIPLHFDIFRLTKTRFQLVTPTVLELLKPGPQCLAYAGGGTDFRDFQLHIPSGNQRWQWEITEKLCL